MARAVLDASALLAFMLDEDGAADVAAALEGGCAISTVNLAEALSKLAEAGDDPAATLARLEGLGDGLETSALGPDDAVAIARLRPLSRSAGLSLADRACLALAQRLGLPALTADRAWGRAEVAVEIIQIRNR